MSDVHNALHKATRLQSAYRVALGADDETFSGIERGGETLTPVINLWERPEWAFLRGDELRSTFISLAAGGAGTFGEAQVVNPAASRIMVTVEKVFTIEAARFLAELNLTNIIATNDLGIAPRDTRLPGSSIVRVRSGNAGVAAITTRWYKAANTETDLAWVLRPGTLLRIQVDTANAAFRCAVSVRQRLCTPQELDG